MAITPNKVTNSNPTKLKVFMFIGEVSESAANWFYTLANIALVTGAVLALVGTIGVIWSGGIREEYSKHKLSDNTRATATANEVAAKANERAATLEKQAADARLELEQLKERQKFREVTAEQRKTFLAMIENAPKGRATVEIFQQDAEITRYANQIKEMMTAGGFDTDNNVAISFGSSIDPVGVFILVKDAEKTPEFCRTAPKRFKGRRYRSQRGTESNLIRK
jgi:hypothetical protein